MAKKKISASNSKFSGPDWIYAHEIPYRDMSDSEVDDFYAEIDRLEEPLREDLRRIGVRVDSAWDIDLKDDPGRSALAIPILLDHLNRRYPARLLEGIARCFKRISGAEVAWESLYRKYRRQPRGEVKDALADTLAMLARSDKFDLMRGLVRDVKQGRSRVLLLSFFSKSRNPEAVALLKEMESDSDLAVQIGEIFKQKNRRSSKIRKDMKKSGE